MNSYKVKRNKILVDNVNSYNILNKLVNSKYLIELYSR